MDFFGLGLHHAIGPDQGSQRLAQGGIVDPAAIAPDT
jgi:hypothetical protein